ncbi:MAG: rhodanese-like domain-containing protein [Chloroflexi bacterium]|nr:rhodanese-like domain-containing protein [Chloroflexota bacterium]
MSQRKKWISLIAGAALFAAALACNFASPQQATDFPTPPPFATENPYYEVERVSLEEAKAAFDSGAAIFVDARSAASYAESHIPGALSIPVAELESRLNELDPDQWIITYCT